MAFTVTLSDGNRTRQKLHKALPIAEVPAFLTRELPDLAMGDLQLKDRQPVDAAAQFDALARRAGEFSRLGSFEQSIPLARRPCCCAPPTAPSIFASWTSTSASASGSRSPARPCRN